MTFRVFRSIIISENFTEEVVGFDYARLADEDEEEAKMMFSVFLNAFFINYTFS